MTYSFISAGFLSLNPISQKSVEEASSFYFLFFLFLRIEPALDVFLSMVLIWGFGLWFQDQN